MEKKIGIKKDENNNPITENMISNMKNIYK